MEQNFKEIKDAARESYQNHGTQDNEGGCKSGADCYIAGFLAGYKYCDGEVWVNVFEPWDIGREYKTKKKKDIKGWDYM